MTAPATVPSLLSLVGGFQFWDTKNLKLQFGEKIALGLTGDTFGNFVFMLVFFEENL